MFLPTMPGFRWSGGVPLGVWVPNPAYERATHMLASRILTSDKAITGHRTSVVPIGQVGFKAMGPEYGWVDVSKREFYCPVFWHLDYYKSRGMPVPDLMEVRCEADGTIIRPHIKRSWMRT